MTVPLCGLPAPHLCPVIAWHLFLPSCPLPSYEEGLTSPPSPTGSSMAWVSASSSPHGYYVSMCELPPWHLGRQSAAEGDTGRSVTWHSSERGTLWKSMGVDSSVIYARTWGISCPWPLDGTPSRREEGRLKRGAATLEKHLASGTFSLLSFLLSILRRLRVMFL